MGYKKCSFVPLGRRTEQLRRKADPEKRKKIEEDKKKRLALWRKMWQ